ncbi:apolipoprotein N-acyltransferase [Deinococcus yavapaiensis]|uniref:Apolipoprotein N-acyltransferase n=1 Tax=Deinococcus yavapaiensis KR-236 TaxID=694435 RepID=A0A318SKD2_9DEIO|nr:apolipoprotein N-acyltransferase [Deinococcus yavapaiensis]PYE53035.1 apolipoprotein N-acyltransferase [Deinococcus yavapaiensis KR-236]
MPILIAALALLLGAALAGCSIPLPWSFLAPVPLAFLFAFVAAAPTPKNGAWRAFLAGFAFFTLHLMWLPESFGAGFGPFGVVMFLPVFALLGVFVALLAFVTSSLTSAWWARVWLLAFGWVLVEWLRHLGPLAFPWGTLGYTTLPTPAVQIADLGGVLLLSLLVTSTGATLAMLVRREWRPLVPMTLLWLGALGYGASRTLPQGEPGRALLLRTTFAQFEKVFDFDAYWNQQLALTSQVQPGELVVWSETSVLSPAWIDRLPNRPMITGVNYSNSDGSWSNSVISWNDGVLARGDKVKLVPFGEYSPLARELRPVYDFFYTRFVGAPFTVRRPGTDMRPLPLEGRAYGAYICYESVFGALTAKLAREGAEVLVNVSNDGWFNPLGVAQHFAMGRVRAIETRRYVLRSVNLGVAGVVDPLGRPGTTFDGPSSGVVHARFDFLSAETPYTRFGDLPVVLLSAALALATLFLARRASPQESSKQRLWYRGRGEG